MAILDYQEFLNSSTELLCDNTTDPQIIAIVLINFDGLAELDGILGYSHVDLLLQKAAQRVEEAFSETDLVGYVGRHQLACLFTLQNAGFAELAGHKLLRILTHPYSHYEHRLIIAARIGIAVSDQKMAQNAYELLRQANLAMQQAAKEHETIKIYTPKADAFLISELELLSDFDKAIEESRIFIVYQPHLSLATGRIVGAEALLRWSHPQRGAVSPSSMVHLAERTGLITKLTFWVFNTVMRHYAECCKAGLNIGVSVNFSATNLREADLVEVVSQALELWNVPPDHVVIELTETAIMDEHEHTLKVLRRFKEMGLQISMDDFGTGYSSMALLQKLPIDELKIDISFIRNMMESSDNEHMVDSIIGLAHKLGLRVIAEGVEDWPTLNRLDELGCDIIQGYIVGRPMILQEFISMAATYQRPVV